MAIIDDIGMGVGILQGIKGLFSNPEKQAWKYQKRAMALQYDYGQRAAQADYQRNLNMWNATNYEAQRQHMENAGLSVGLMYGNGGAQAASTAGGNATQPDGMAINPVMAKIQAQQANAQTTLALAEAKKANAEADKISGVDTENMKLQNEWQKLENRINEQFKWDNAYEENTRLGFETLIRIKDYAIAVNEAEISDRTKEDKINQVKETVANLQADTKLKGAKIELTEEQKKLAKEQWEHYAEMIAAQTLSAKAAWKQAEEFAKKVKNDYKQKGIELDQHEEEILQEWWNIGLSNISDLVKAFAFRKKATSERARATQPQQ